MVLFLWFLCVGIAYGMSMDEEKPSTSKQLKVIFYSLFIFPLIIGLALREHMNNVSQIKENTKKFVFKSVEKLN